MVYRNEESKGMRQRGRDLISPNHYSPTVVEEQVQWFHFVATKEDPRETFWYKPIWIKARNALFEGDISKFRLRLDWPNAHVELSFDECFLNNEMTIAYANISFIKWYPVLNMAITFGGIPLITLGYRPIMEVYKLRHGQRYDIQFQMSHDLSEWEDNQS